MKRLLFILLSFLIMTGTVLADKATQNALDKMIPTSLNERIRNHPDAEKMGENWYRIRIKENISDTAFDWRFDIRTIHIVGIDITIGHRMEQNSGNHPDSNWVIEYTFIDRFGDRILDMFYKERFISVEDNGTWFRVSIRWPDGFRYPQPTKEEMNKLYEKELEYWENKLQ